MKRSFPGSNHFFKKCVLFAFQLFTAGWLQAQPIIPLNSLSAFQAPAPNWQIAGDAEADILRNGRLSAYPGTGVLVSIPDEKVHGKDIYTIAEHGDADLELDYLMASGSNSGIYLQGRYEIQLRDNWSFISNSKAGDNGGIYERWDESRPGAYKGYEGYPPRMNVSRAPGLWQHIKISFQAPRFDASGIKTANAKIVSLELNGVLVQENADLSGPTRGAMSNTENAMGPLRFQGDHGAVAFRNIRLVNYPAGRPVLPAPDDNNSGVDPILINASGNTILRSFIDLPGIRLTHSVSVGSSQQLHYTYDADNGFLAQLWRGGFLDATPMWHDRGDGSSRPRGAVLLFGKPAPFVQLLTSDTAAWASDTSGSGFRQKGYVLDGEDRPVFRYTIYGNTINDAFTVLPDGKGLRRSITVPQSIPGMYARLATAPDIRLLANGLYLVGDRAYYLRIDESGTGKALIRSSHGNKELLIPVQQKLTYSILY